MPYKSRTAGRLSPSDARHKLEMRRRRVHGEPHAIDSTVTKVSISGVKRKYDKDGWNRAYHASRTNPHRWRQTSPRRGNRTSSFRRGRFSSQALGLDSNQLDKLSEALLDTSNPQLLLFQQLYQQFYKTYTAAASAAAFSVPSIFPPTDLLSAASSSSLLVNASAHPPSRNSTRRFRGHRHRKSPDGDSSGSTPTHPRPAVTRTPSHGDICTEDRERSIEPKKSKLSMHHLRPTKQKLRSSRQDVVSKGSLDWH